jgi:hypothetical protein
MTRRRILKFTIVAAAAACFLTAAAPASAQFITGHIGGVPFSGYSGPMGFGAGFAQGLANAQAADALSTATAASEAQAAALSPVQRCIDIRADALMRQKKLPPADVVRAKMEQARAYCEQAFGKPQRRGSLFGLFGGESPARTGNTAPPIDTTPTPWNTAIPKWNGG